MVSLSDSLNFTYPSLQVPQATIIGDVTIGISSVVSFDGNQLPSVTLVEFMHLVML